MKKVCATGAGSASPLNEDVVKPAVEQHVARLGPETSLLNRADHTCPCVAAGP